MKNQSKTKRVKAWAILGKRNKAEFVLFGKACPEMFYIGSWGPYDTCREKVVPCTITYNIKEK